MLQRHPKLQINCHDRPRPARCVSARGYGNLGEVDPGMIASACQPPLDYMPPPLRAMAQFGVRAAVDLIETGERSSLLIQAQFVEQASTRALSRGRRRRPALLSKALQNGAPSEARG